MEAGRCGRERFKICQGCERKSDMSSAGTYVGLKRSGVVVRARRGSHTVLRRGDARAQISRAKGLQRRDAKAQLSGPKRCLDPEGRFDFADFQTFGGKRGRGGGNCDDWEGALAGLGRSSAPGVERRPAPPAMCL